MLPKTSRTQWRRFSSAGGRLFVLLAYFWVAQVYADGFTVELDRDTISYGEGATLTLHFEGGEPQGGFSLPTVPNLNVGNPSQSVQQSMVIDNGRAKSSVSVAYSYALAPQRPGNYNFPAMSAVLNGKTYLSQPFTLKVLEAGQARPMVSGTFIKLLVPKTDVYVGEIVPVEVQIFFQSIRGFDGFHFNEQGFTMGKLLNPVQTGSTVINGRQYNVAVMKTYVVPIKTGQLALGPASIQLSIPADNSPRDFFGRIVNWQNVTLESNPLALHVLPLPNDNVPAGFNGAIGEFNLALSASPTNIAVGDPITVKIQISGQGALEGVSLPQQTAWTDFKLYPPTTDFQTGDQLGMTGTKTFSLTAVPQSLAIKELPPFEFTFFDPNQKAYRTLSQPAVPLIVRPAAASVSAPNQMAVNGSSENPVPNGGLAPLKQRPGQVVNGLKPLITQPVFLTVPGLPMLAWLVLLVRNKQVERLAKNPRRRREMAVAKTVRDGLASLPKSAQAGAAEEFFATVFRLLQERLGERLDLPASAITESVLDDHDKELTLTPEKLQTVRELFRACDQARYARTANREELVSLVPKVEAALQELEASR